VDIAADLTASFLDAVSLVFERKILNFSSFVIIGEGPFGIGISAILSKLHPT